MGPALMVLKANVKVTGAQEDAAKRRFALGRELASL